MMLQGLDAKVKDKAWKMITLRKRRLVVAPHKVQPTMQLEENTVSSAAVQYERRKYDAVEVAEIYIRERF